MAGELFSTLMTHTQAARRTYSELVGYYPADKQRSRRLIMRHVKELQKSVALDELMLHALAVKYDYD